MPPRLHVLAPSLVLLLASSLVAGLGRTQPPRRGPPRGQAAPRSAPRISLEIELAPGEVTLTYRPAEARTRLPLLLVPPESDRETTWEMRPGPQGQRPALARAGERDVLVVPEPTREFRVRLEIPAGGRAEVWERETHRFLDVGLLLPAGPPGSDAEVAVTLRAPELWIAGAGRAARGELAWPPGDAALLESTPVYVGPREPADYGDFHLVVTPSLPSWMAESAHAYLPRIYTALSEMAGGTVAWKPLVALAYQPSTDAARAEVLPGGQGGLLEMTAAGGGWVEESPDGVISWLWSLSHDLVHVWNQEAYRPAFPAEDEWLIEGTADFLALQALRKVQLLPEGEARRYLGDRVRACAHGLAGPFVEARGGVASDCGVTVWTAAEAAVRARLGSGRSTRSLFTGLLERADPSYHYTRFGFLEVVRRLTGDAGLTRQLSRLIEVGPEGSSTATLDRLLRHVGMAMELPTPRED